MQTGEDSSRSIEPQNPRLIQSQDMARISGIDNPAMPLLNSGTAGAGGAAIDVRLSETEAA
jgi:hypothetical protein